jgi:Uma2 family endonuclease
MMHRRRKAMRIQTEATIDDLRHVPENGKAELVNGELVIISPAGGLHNYAATEIALSLRAYARNVGKGYAISDNCGFIVDLPHRKSFSPDAAYHVGELTLDFVRGAPVFAVEVRSLDDYGTRAERILEKKRADYFAAGTQVIWDVDLIGEDAIRVYRATEPETATIYRRGGIAEAEPAVPGWSMPVDDLFPQR